MVLNSVQLFGIVLLGGLCAGELSRRILNLPRTTGYVLCGLLLGQSGLQWISAEHIHAAQLLIDIALGLILFELGYMIPRAAAPACWHRLGVGVAMSLISATAIAVTMLAWGFALRPTVFAAALCLATSPAITIATTSDVGARGDKTDLLLTLVAINGSMAFIGATWATSALALSLDFFSGAVVLAALLKIVTSLMLAGGCAGLVLAGASRLGQRPDHQHLLIIGTIVLGIGMAIALDLSVIFPMLFFGWLTQVLDGDHSVVPIRIAKDARIFLVITFVLAGASLDLSVLLRYWPVAVTIIFTRFLAQILTLYFYRKTLGISARCAGFTAIGLQPMSSVALILLAGTQTLNGALHADLAGPLMATIVLLQLAGPPATQAAIVGFSEATSLNRQLGDASARAETVSS